MLANAFFCSKGFFAFLSETVRDTRLCEAVGISTPRIFFLLLVHVADNASVAFRLCTKIFRQLLRMQRVQDARP